jgi:hypothetical protein
MVDYSEVCSLFKICKSTNKAIRDDRTWMNDTFPELEKVFALSKCFDLILAGAI